MSHPAWYSTVWQTYDYDLDVNGTYFGAKKACEPHQVQASSDSWRVTVLNHTNSILRGRVEATVHSLSRTVLSTQSADVEVGPSARSGLFEVSPHASPLHLVRLRLSDGDRRTGARAMPTIYSDNHLWLLPGESREVTLSWHKRALTSEKPRVTVEAHNA
ncbi:hypothetical protein ACSHWB_42625 [Lentzea sp. HUAS TT2]|uniref:hypothetical protein n=1 Tax=Lentzea sp. HUAS TT2 TaxID=3447454 RepID=UPI003F7233FE